MIKNDHYGEILTSGKLEIDKGLYLLESKLGWILSGRTKTKQEPKYAMTVFTQTKSRIQNQINNNLTMETAFSSDSPLEDFWRSENIGITDNPRQSDDERLVQYFSETVKKENCRYNASWPWIEKNPNLPRKLWIDVCSTQNYNFKTPARLRATDEVR